MGGKLYIVPTPVGNLGDMTPRALDVLRKVSLILAEDTRTSGVLMRRFGVDTSMVSHHKFNEHDTAESVIDKVEAGEDIALISDAGTPGISDPGFMLSRECRKRGISVETLPGPTAFVPALVDSGLPCDRFVFEGFLPVKKGRMTRIAQLSQEERTFIIYESPLRLVKTLTQLADACGKDRDASVSREISKLHETTHRGTLGQLLDFFANNQPRGEIVIIVSGKKDDAGEKIHVNKYKTYDSGNF